MLLRAGESPRKTHCWGETSHAGMQNQATRLGQGRNNLLQLQGSKLGAIVSLSRNYSLYKTISSPSCGFLKPVGGRVRIGEQQFSFFYKALHIFILPFFLFGQIKVRTTRDGELVPSKAQENKPERFRGSSNPALFTQDTVSCSLSCDLGQE